MPPGAVAGVEGEEARFVARRLGEQGEMLAAVLERGEGVGARRVLVVGRYQVVEASECDLLVELEPVAYQLTVEEYTKVGGGTYRPLASTSRGPARAGSAPCSPPPPSSASRRASRRCSSS